jgi:hypothetical protein
VAELAPGDCLYIPSLWLHEVHSLTPSFSLGWRVAMRDDATGRRTERNVGQKLERLSTSVKGGKLSLESSLTEALTDPALAETVIKSMGEMLRRGERLPSAVKGGELSLESSLKEALADGPGMVEMMMGEMRKGGGSGAPTAQQLSAVQQASAAMPMEQLGAQRHAEQLGAQRHAEQLGAQRHAKSLPTPVTRYPTPMEQLNRRLGR